MEVCGFALAHHMVLCCLLLHLGRFLALPLDQYQAQAWHLLQQKHVSATWLLLAAMVPVWTWPVLKQQTPETLCLVLLASCQQPCQGKGLCNSMAHCLAG